MKRILPALIGLVLISTVAIAFFLHSKNASAATNHIVISEVQISGTNGVNDEFVELYNPTDSAIDLSGWRLSRRTSGGTLNTLVSNISGTIPAHGYFLIAHSASYSGATSADLNYSAPSQNIATNNSVVLFSDAEITQVDLVGMGGAVASETATASNPPGEGGSIERKANSLSDSISMASGGADEFEGNGEDSDNNTNDFVTRDVSQPQNTQSEIEPIVEPTPTPSEEPSPTEDPSPPPTSEPSVTPSPEPSVTPTTEPTPTSAPSPTVQPTPSTQPTTPIPTQGPIIVTKNPIITCSVTFKPIKIFKYVYFFPIINCEKTVLH